ncbi:MAG: S49 family peptidase [Pseudomonadota bacterium]
MKNALSRLPLIGRLFGPPPPTVAMIRMAGVVGAEGRFRRGLTLEQMAKPIDAAFACAGLKAVGLIINSPGGSPVQSRLLHDRVRALAKEKSVPVFAFAEDVAASGGYMLAVAADEIYADESSIVGSIGVISAGFGFTGLIEKLGVERRVHTAGENKSLLDPFQPEREEDVERLKGIQRAVHASFVDLVRTRRGERIAGADEDLFEGAFWTGARALELGLIDGLIEPRRFFRDRFGEDVRLKDVTASRARLGRFMGGEKTIALPGGFIDDAVGVVEARQLWSRYGL